MTGQPTVDERQNITKTWNLDLKYSTSRVVCGILCSAVQTCLRCIIIMHVSVGEKCYFDLVWVIINYLKLKRNKNYPVKLLGLSSKCISRYRSNTIIMSYRHSAIKTSGPNSNQNLWFKLANNNVKPLCQFNEYFHISVYNINIFWEIIKHSLHLQRN